MSCVASFTILSYRLILDTAKKNGLSWDAVFSCEAIGKYIKINGIAFKVVGIFEDAGGEGEMEKIYLPITAEVSVGLGGVRWQSCGCFRSFGSFDFIGRRLLRKSPCCPRTPPA